LGGLAGPPTAVERAHRPPPAQRGAYRDSLSAFPRRTDITAGVGSFSKRYTVDLGRLQP